MRHGHSCVHDIFYHDDRTSRDVHVESYELPHGPCGLCPLIGRQLHEGDFAGEVNLSEQISSEDECSIEHRQEYRLLPPVVLIDACCHCLYSLQYFLFGNGYGEGLVLHLDVLSFDHDLFIVPQNYEKIPTGLLR